MNTKNKKRVAAEDPMSPGHHMGTSYGYNVLPDGSVQVAPCIADGMNAILHREAGLREYARTANEYLIQEFERLEKLKQEWWAQLPKEYPVINLATNWSYHVSGRLCVPKKEEQK